MAYSPAATGYHGSSIPNFVLVYLNRTFAGRCTFTLVQDKLYAWKPDHELVVVDFSDFDGANLPTDIVERVEKALKEKEMIDTEKIETDLLSRYTGHSEAVRKWIHLAVKSLENGHTIGHRATPVISFWMMREKWNGRGLSWHHLGTDGDVTRDLVYPAILRLVYFKTTDGLVCQLVIVLKDSRFVTQEDYQQARLSLWTSIESEEYIAIPRKTVKHHGQSEIATEDILTSMNRIYGA